jgi:hypothetical protein
MAYTPYELWDYDECKHMKTDVCIEYCNVKEVRYQFHITMKCKFVFNCYINFSTCYKMHSMHGTETVFKKIEFFWVAGGEDRITGIVIDCVVQCDAEFHMRSYRRYYR